MYIRHLIIAFVFLSFVQGQCFAAEPIKGRVEKLNLEATYGDNKMQGQSPELDESEPLKGKAEHNDLSGQTEKSGWQGEPGVADLDKEIGLLKGTAKKQGAMNLNAEDPDAEDQELMIEWDRWRNRFLRAVQLGMMEIVNSRQEQTYRWDQQRRVMTSAFPMGTEAWFVCNVTPNLKVQSLKLLRSSGYPEYDRAVVEAVRALEDTKILRFPERSKRPFVSQAAGIRTAQSADYQYHHFGDVEHQRIPGN